MREPGYYWVRLKGFKRPDIAYCAITVGGRTWYMTNYGPRFNDADFDFIGEHLVPPEMPAKE